jgi:hypothetical protein
MTAESADRDDVAYRAVPQIDGVDSLTLVIGDQKGGDAECRHDEVSCCASRHLRTTPSRTSTTTASPALGGSALGAESDAFPSADRVVSRSAQRPLQISAPP